MIYHTVWFKLREDFSPEDVQELTDNLLAMIPEIPQILEMNAGQDFSGRSRGFEFGLVVKFATCEDGQIYDKHPAHQAFIAKSKYLWADVQALDFEV